MDAWMNGFMNAWMIDRLRTHTHTLPPSSSASTQPSSSPAASAAYDNIFFMICSATCDAITLSSHTPSATAASPAIPSVCKNASLKSP